MLLNDFPILIFEKKMFDTASTKQCWLFGVGKPRCLLTCCVNFSVFQHAATLIFDDHMLLYIACLIKKLCDAESEG